MDPRVSVVVLSHNKCDCTRRCLTTLLDSDGCDWELIVVDNGSTDGTRAWLETFEAEAAAAGVGLTVILNDGNPGCSTTRNQGAAAARGRYLAFADNDVTRRTRQWAALLADALEADPRRGVVGPRLVYPYPPHDIQCAGVDISPRGRVRFRGRGASREDPRFDREQPVQCLISACFMLPRTRFEEAGGFDEAFNPVEYEDFDLCYRVRERGYEARYVPSVEMYHFESITTTGTAALPNTYLVIKHGLLFQRRWRHMFEREGGPPDDACRWKTMPARSLEDAELRGV